MTLESLEVERRRRSQHGVVPGLPLGAPTCWHATCTCGARPGGFCVCLPCPVAHPCQEQDESSNQADPLANARGGIALAAGTPRVDSHWHEPFSAGAEAGVPMLGMREAHFDDEGAAFGHTGASAVSTAWIPDGLAPVGKNLNRRLCLGRSNCAAPEWTGPIHLQRVLLLFPFSALLSFAFSLSLSLSHFRPLSAGASQPLRRTTSWRSQRASSCMCGPEY